MPRQYTVEANGRATLKPLPQAKPVRPKEERLKGTVRASVYDGEGLRQKCWQTASLSR